MRRWLALARKEPGPIDDLNRIVARFTKFSRAEIGKVRRRIDAEPGRAGDRQAVVACLSLLWGAEKPVVLAPEEALTLPAALALAGLAALICQAMRGILPERRPEGIK